MLNKQNSPFAPKSNKKRGRRPASFVEALKGIGGGTVKSIKDDLIKPTSSDFFSSMIGGKTGTSSNENTQSGGKLTPEWMSQQEATLEKEARLRRRHQEIMATPVYNRQEEEVKQEIEAIRKELKLLAKEIAKMASQTQKAVEEEVVNPGTYHLSFFQKIRRFLITVRKQASESQNWLTISYQRKQSQKHYWGSVKKSGTKFMMSQERYAVTSTG